MWVGTFAIPPIMSHVRGNDDYDDDYDGHGEVDKEEVVKQEEEVLLVLV